MTTDKRRYGVIEVRRINAETYWLEIAGEMWSEVEWSRERQMWCVQDAAGHCLVHTEHIVGQDRDPQTAIRLAKRMIVDGRMPTRNRHTINFGLNKTARGSGNRSSETSPPDRRRFW